MPFGGAGLQFGLTVPAAKAKAKPGGAARRPPDARAREPAFGGGDDDDDDGGGGGGGGVQGLERFAGVGAAVRRQADVADARARAEIERLMASDPNVFAYDDNADDEKGKGAQHAPAVPRESRYISGMLATAKRRAADGDLAHERRARKEARLDDAEFGDKERFVTASYRKKLEEEKKWLADEAAAEARNAAKPHNAMAMRIELQQSARGVVPNDEAVAVPRESPKQVVPAPEQSAEDIPSAAPLEPPAKPSDEGTRATSGMQRERTPSGGENAAERSSTIAAARARYLERRKQKQQAPPP